MAVEFRILGPVDARVDGRRIGLNGKQRSLLALLLLSAGRLVPAERLAAGLWGEPLPAAVGVRVRTLVSELRRALQPAELIATRSPGYVLRVEPGQLDLTRFTDLVEQARAARRPDLAVGHYDEAIALWGGVPLDGASGPFVDLEVPRLVELRLHAVEERTDAMLALGRHGELIAELSGLVAEHPTRERPHGQLMLALYRCGRRGDTLDVYRRLRARLVDDLGLEPTPELQRLHQQVLAGDPALERLTPTVQAAPPAPSRQLPPDTGRLVGRRATLDRLDELHGRRERLVLVVGAAGVGKTTAVVHWAHRVAARFPDGQLFLDLRGFDRAAPMTHAEALPRLLRALGTPADAVPLTVAEQIPLFRTLTAQRRLLLVLDNVAEPEQVRPLLPASPHCLTVVTSRDRLDGLVALDGARRLTLDVLAPDAAVDVLTQVAGAAGAADAAADPAAALDLARLCGYLPLALRIAGARLADQPHQSLRRQVDELAEHGSLVGLRVEGDRRADVRGTFTLSYHHLAAPARHLFRRLGLVPAPAGLTVAATAALAGTSSTEAARLLDTLARVHLVTATAADRFTCHDLLVDYAAERAAEEDPPHDRDAAVHRLLDFYLHTIDNSAGAVFGPAGRLPRAAIRDGVEPLRFTDVGEARAWMANEWLNVVAALRHAAATGPRAMAWQLADALRPLVRLGVSMPELQTIGELGLAAAEAEGDPLGAGAMHFLLGQLPWHTADYQASIERCERALALFRRAGWREGQSTVLRRIATSLLFLGRMRDGIDRLAEALEIDRETGDRFGEAITLTNLAAACLERGDLTGALRYNDLALPALDETGHRHGRAVALANLGLVQYAQGRLAPALATMQQALAASERVGARHHQASVLISIGTVHCDAGRPEAATAALTTALDLATEIGDARLELYAHHGLGGVEIQLGRAGDAITRLEKALQLAAPTTVASPTAPGAGSTPDHAGRDPSAGAAGRDAGAEGVGVESGGGSGGGAGVDRSGQPRARVEALLTLTRAHLALGDHSAARDRAGEALGLAESAGYLLMTAQARSLSAAARLGLGDVFGCLDEAGRALWSQQRAGQLLAQARTLSTLAEAHEQAGATDTAAACRSRAATLFEATAAET